MGEISLYYIMKSKGYSLERLGAIVGMDGRNVGRCLNGEQEMKFERMLKAVMLLAPEEERARMESYILNMKVNSKNLTQAIEYASINRMKLCSEYLIGIMSDLGKEYKEWAQMYKFSLQYQFKEMPYKELLQLVDQYHVETLEMRVFKKMLKVYLFNHTGDYGMAIRFAIEVGIDINLLPEGFLKKSYEIRVLENYALVYTHSNRDLQKAIESSEQVIERAISEVFRANAYNNLGHCYMFTDYEKAITNFLLANDLFDRLGLPSEMVKANIRFLKNYWNKHIQAPIGDASEVAHYLIKNGQKEEGIKILDSLDSGSPFKLYYRWLATGNQNYLLEAAQILKDRKDYFYLNGLIRPELEKIEGFSQMMIDLICK